MTLDGVDARDLPLDALRAQMGIALQDAVLFSGIIRDNIRYRRPDATENRYIGKSVNRTCSHQSTSLPIYQSTSLSGSGG